MQDFNFFLGEHAPGPPLEPFFPQFASNLLCRRNIRLAYRLKDITIWWPPLKNFEHVSDMKH